MCFSIAAEGITTDHLFGLLIQVIVYENHGGIPPKGEKSQNGIEGHFGYLNTCILGNNPDVPGTSALDKLVCFLLKDARIHYT